MIRRTTDCVYIFLWIERDRENVVGMQVKREHVEINKGRKYRQRREKTIKLQGNKVHARPRCDGGMLKVECHLPPALSVLACFEFASISCDYLSSSPLPSADQKAVLLSSPVPSLDSTGRGAYLRR
jgi:hypothetical protein